MRTKTLLLTAALGAASLASASAQVYSVNAVGYVNVTVPVGFSMIANPLLSGNDTIGGLFPNVPDGTQIFKFGLQGAATTPTFAGQGYDAGWPQPTISLNPGEGAFILNPGPGVINLTFVGTVPQGNLTQNVPAGFSIQASQVPQSAGVDVLGFVADDGDTIFTFSNSLNRYVSKAYDAGWPGGAPVPAVAESFFVLKGVAGTWVRTFSVNTP